MNQFDIEAYNDFLEIIDISDHYNCLEVEYSDLDDLIKGLTDFRRERNRKLVRACSPDRWSESDAPGEPDYAYWFDVAEPHEKYAYINIDPDGSLHLVLTSSARDGSVPVIEEFQVCGLDKAITRIKEWVK